MTNRLEDEIQRIVEHMDNQERQGNPQTPHEEIKDVYVLIVREQEDAEEDQSNVVESTSTPVIRQQDSFISAYLFVCFSLFLILSTLTFQLYSMFNPPIATITILPRSQIVTLTDTLQLGRLLNPITISQSLTTPATGKGYQDARAATGTVIFYNGLFTQQFVASGTIYTGNDGEEIVTTQNATIPPGDPSSGYGTATVPAQAVEAGSTGNIHAGDVSININNGLLVKNTQFHNGQDARTYTTVTQKDIHSVSTVLKTILAHSITGALQGQIHQGEALQFLPCTPTVTSDHPIGAEASSVNVTVSQTCSAVAYNSQELQTKATAFLATQARQKAGAGYSLFEEARVSVTQASAAQEQIKHLIAGKTTQQAVSLLASSKGIEQVSIRFSGFGDATRLPKLSKNIHLTIIVVQCQFCRRAKKDRFLNRFSGILRGNKKKSGEVATCNRQLHPPACQELACSRLAIFYHKIGSISPQSNSCHLLGNGVRHCLQPQSAPNLVLCCLKPAHLHANTGLQYRTYTNRPE